MNSENKQAYCFSGFKNEPDVFLESDILKLTKLFRELSNKRRLSRKITRRRGVAGIIPLSFAGTVLSGAVFSDSKTLAVLALVSAVGGVTGIAGAIDSYKKVNILKQKENSCYKKIRTLRNIRNSQGYSIKIINEE